MTESNHSPFKNELWLQFEKVLSGQVLKYETSDGLIVENKNPNKLLSIIEEDTDKPLFILVSGTSESGKSHFGKKIVSDGIGHRLKIYKTISQMIHVDNSHTGKDASKLSSQAIYQSDLRLKIGDWVINDYLSKTDKTGVPIAVIETIKHPWLIQEFKRHEEIRTISLFIDAPFKERIDRETIKSKQEIDIVAKRTLKKDKEKKDLGLDKIKKLSDLIIWNGGEKESYDQFIEILEKIIKINSKTYSGKTKDYS